ncbi:MAG: hypothetical protein JSW26_11955 [Desulfobacterales bacterium]|nr:MAG: hypothetical protein JSW26_11955 [Desulfobacterales bacterium]
MQVNGIRRPRLFLMMVLVFVLASITFVQGEISAAPIGGLYSTGVNDSGDVLPDGSKDPHYQFLLPNPAATTDPSKIPLNTLPGPWVPAPAGSAWIGPNAGGPIGPGGNYSYVLTFDLLGFDLSTVSISGEWASDNSSSIFLNGNFTDYSRAFDQFGTLEPFTLTEYFVPGSNTLEFVVNNAGDGATGLIVARLEGTGAEVPLPGAIWLLGTSLIVLLAIKRKLRS